MLAAGALPVRAQAPEPRAPTVVGVALSGGSAKGFAHIGVLRTLERLGVRVDVVAGTSMGAVVGGLYAIGLSVDSIETIMTDADWSALIGDGIPRGRLSVDQRRLDERTVLNVPLRDRRITLPAGAIVGSNVMRILEHVTWRAATVRRFDHLPRPFVAVATDLETTPFDGSPQLLLDTRAGTLTIGDVSSRPRSSWVEIEVSEPR